jgi:hypothetical protein
MSVSTTITALQTLHNNINGIKAAPTAMPSVLNTSELPIALVWPGDADWRAQAIDLLKRQERTYIVRVYVQPIAREVAGIDKGYQRCITLLQLFGAAYVGDITLSGDVDHITSITDSGVSGGGFELTWGDVGYWGFVYRLRIVEKST